jgi:hypothetical protein
MWENWKQSFTSVLHGRESLASRLVVGNSSVFPMNSSIVLRGPGCCDEDKNITPCGNQMTHPDRGQSLSRRNPVRTLQHTTIKFVY